MQEKKFKFLVADTTAFINNVQLHEYAETILTVPDVVNEVKNKRQIRRLVVLPFDLQVLEPAADCLKFVTEFAKKTGDFASLSAIDLKVLALTYDLERQNVGTEHLRTEPIVRRVIASKNKPDELVNETPLAGFFIPKGSVNSEADGDCAKSASLEEEEASDHVVCSGVDAPSNISTNEEEPFETQSDDKAIDYLAQYLKKMSPLEGNSSDNDGIPENTLEVNVTSDEEKSAINIEDILVPKVEESSEEEDEECTSDEENSEDDSSWITPTNIQNVKKQFKGEAEEDKPVTVACMSTDYAIQNVLKQINLNIAALNGRIIKQLRTYILRCYACFKTTSIMTKIFCPYCGNKTLKKVAVSLDENGQQVIHINLRRPLTSKYKNQSLPRPKGGKHSQNPILVEDQPIPRQMPSRVAKTKTNALHDDYIAGYSPFVMRDVDSKSAILRTKGNIKQWARNNMYEENRRRKRSSRLVK